MSVIGHSNAPPQRWLRSLASALHGEPTLVRVVLAAVRGSAPREAGVSMLVGRQRLTGTIGGGQLEWDAIAAARGLLDETTAPARLQRVVLGADLGQCCGGVVEVWLERYTRADLPFLEAAEQAARHSDAELVSTLDARGVTRKILRKPNATGILVTRGGGGGVTFVEPLNDMRPPLWLYGAGHVGQALGRILLELPLRLTWVDSRADVFPAVDPDAVQILRGVDAVASVSDAPVGTRFIVMTHSHLLDFALCHAILERNDFASAGLIGSLSKAARFRSRLRRSGLTPDSVARLVCPIGIGGIDSKWPAAIAVGVAAQLMRDLRPAGRDVSHRAPEAELDLGCAAGNCATCGSPP